MLENEIVVVDFENQHRDIVEGCMAGERKAQQQLYSLYSKAMYNVCCRMLGNDADAEDILQNSFIVIFTKIDSFRFQSAIGAWIKRIVVNNCINFLKKKRINFEIMDDTMEAVALVDVAPPETTLSVDKINKAMYQLSDGYRQVFSLFLMEGYDHSEIADILGISVSTSKSQYSRAKKKLRSLLESEY